MQCIPVVLILQSVKFNLQYMQIYGLTQLCLRCLYYNVLLFSKLHVSTFLMGDHQAYNKRCLYTIVSL
jgi:hypothetical protein